MAMRQAKPIATASGVGAVYCTVVAVLFALSSSTTLLVHAQPNVNAPQLPLSWHGMCNATIQLQIAGGHIVNTSGLCAFDELHQRMRLDGVYSNSISTYQLILFQYFNQTLSQCNAILGAAGCQGFSAAQQYSVMYLYIYNSQQAPSCTYQASQASQIPYPYFDAAFDGVVKQVTVQGIPAYQWTYSATFSNTITWQVLVRQDNTSSLLGYSQTGPGMSLNLTVSRYTPALPPATFFNESLLTGCSQSTFRL